MQTITNGKEVTRTQVIYTYDELSDKAKKAVVERWREVAYEHLNSGEILETIQDHILGTLSEGKFATWDNFNGSDRGQSGNLKVEYSLSHCQGDGVAFYGRLYRNDAPRLNWGVLQDNVGLNEVRLIRNSHGNHYSHYNCFNLEFYNEDGDLIGTDGGLRDDIVVYLKEDMTSSLSGTSDTDKMTADQLAMWQCMTDINKALRQLSKDCERVGYRAIDDMTSEQSALDWIECDSTPRKYERNGEVADHYWWE